MYSIEELLLEFEDYLFDVMVIDGLDVYIIKNEKIDIFAKEVLIIRK